MRRCCFCLSFFVLTCTVWSKRYLTGHTRVVHVRNLTSIGLLHIHHCPFRVFFLHHFYSAFACSTFNRICVVLLLRNLHLTVSSDAFSSMPLDRIARASLTFLVSFHALRRSVGSFVPSPCSHSCGARLAEGVGLYLCTGAEEYCCRLECREAQVNARGNAGLGRET
ncbi:hypothetical protein Micbo1qcDRAFT_51471 [Microdochium bolleyi]|uniref:Secreted protein n=1 Tax=Microdochium bolleyi TaxID=196109 RepID=A0A136J6N3_9PEZI|nr:hypothetical protein Micbo1qcDRAFT_51471 [Microdochium bolleyi]